MSTCDVVPSDTTTSKVSVVSLATDGLVNVGCATAELLSVTAGPPVSKTESPEEAPPLADLLISIPSTETPVVVEVKQLISADDVLWSVERNLTLLSRPDGTIPQGILLLVAAIEGDEQAAGTDELVHTWERESKHDIRIRTPQRAWPVFFEEALSVVDIIYAFVAAALAAFYANRRLNRAEFHALRTMSDGH